MSGETTDHLLSQGILVTGPMGDHTSRRSGSCSTVTTSCSGFGTRRVKAANLRRELRVAVVVDDERPPFAFVLVEGTATLSADLDELRRWATRIAGRYMGPDLTESYGARNDGHVELLVRAHHDKIVAHTSIAD